MTIDVAALLVLGGFGFPTYIAKKFFPAYLAQKGQNLATKEDIAGITKAAEGIKADFEKQLAEFKNWLDSERHKFVTQYSRLDSQRSNGVMGLHAMMCEIEQQLIWKSGASATGIVNATPEARTMEALNAAWEGVAKLNQLLNFHSLLLGDSLYSAVQAWSKEVLAIIAKVGAEVEPLRVAAVTTTATLEEREATIKATQGRHVEAWLLGMGKIRKDIDAQFRDVLGLTG